MPIEADIDPYGKVRILAPVDPKLVNQVWQENFSNRREPTILGCILEDAEYLRVRKNVLTDVKDRNEKAGLINCDIFEYGGELPCEESAAFNQAVIHGHIDSKKFEVFNLVFLRYSAVMIQGMLRLLAHELRHIYNRYYVPESFEYKRHRTNLKQFEEKRNKRRKTKKRRD